MKHGNWLLTAIVPLVLAACLWWTAAADTPAPHAPGAASRPAALHGEWAVLAGEVQLTDDQKARLEARVKAYQDALADWQKENGDKLKAAHETRDANAVKALTAARNKLAADFHDDLRILLTYEQRVKWEGFQLCRTMTTMLHRVSPALTDEEKTRIRALCDAAAKETIELKDENELRAAKARLHARVLEVLTSEQRDSLKKPPQTRPTGH